MPMPTEPSAAVEPARALIDALGALSDYGTAWANKAGAITMPSQARRDLRLPTLSHWRVFGSASLGVAVIVGPRQSPEESLEFLLRAQPDMAADN